MGDLIFAPSEARTDQNECKVRTETTLTITVVILIMTIIEQLLCARHCSNIHMFNSCNMHNSRIFDRETKSERLSNLSKGALVK